MEKKNILIALSIFGWIATFCRAIGMWANGEEYVKLWTSLGNLGWLIVGLIQWRCLKMSMTLAVSNFICLVVFAYAFFK